MEKMEKKKLPTPKSPTFKDISGFFSQIRFFPGYITFLSLRNQKFVWNFVIILSVISEKKWFSLSHWLGDSGAFIRPLFCLKTRVQQYQ